MNNQKRMKRTWRFNLSLVQNVHLWIRNKSYCMHAMGCSKFAALTIFTKCMPIVCTPYPPTKDFITYLQQPITSNAINSLISEKRKGQQQRDGNSIRLLKSAYFFFLTDKSATQEFNIYTLNPVTVKISENFPPKSAQRQRDSPWAKA